jgi:RIO-like serine/threonine protein kinase
MVIKKIGETSASKKVYTHSAYPGYVIKISKLPIATKEFNIQTRLARIGVAPMIHKYTPRVLMEEKCDWTLTKMLPTLTQNHKKQLKQLVEKMWSVGIIHGDLKPDNIMYNKKRDRFFITDFETSKVVKKVTIDEMLKHQHFLDKVHKVYSKKSSKHFGKRFGWPTDSMYYDAIFN